MIIDRIFLRCEICGNVVGVIKDSGVKIECCGQEMMSLLPNTVDAVYEEHIPIVLLEGDMLSVQVGFIPHPMTKEHHIVWIAVAQDCKTQRTELNTTGSPSANFSIEQGYVLIYAYCNLHGLWFAEINENMLKETGCSAEFTEGCLPTKD